MPYAGSYNLGTDSDLLSAAPELLAPIVRTPMGSNPPDQPGMQAGPAVDTSSIPTGNTPGDYVQSILGALVRGYGAGARRPDIEQMGQQSLDRMRRQRAQQQASAIQNILAQVYQTGNQELISSTYKQLSGLKGLEPEVGQLVGQWHMQQAQKMGQMDAQKQAFAQSQADTPGMKYAQGLIQAGVDPKTAFEFGKEIDLRAQGKYVTFGPNRQPGIFHPETQQFIPIQLPEGVLQPKERDTVTGMGTSWNEKAQSMYPDRLPSQLKPEERAKVSEAVALQAKIDKAEAKNLEAQKEMQMKRFQPAPAGTYLDPVTGEVKSPTNVGEWLDQKLIRLDSFKEKKHEALGKLGWHIDAFLKYIDAIPTSGNKLSAYMNSELATINNNPKAKALYEQLEKMTPLAIGGTLTETASGGRSEAMNKRLEMAAPKKDDNLKTALEKLQNLAELRVQEAKTNCIPTRQYEQDLKKIQAIRQGWRFRSGMWVKEQ